MFGVLKLGGYVLKGPNMDLQTLELKLNPAFSHG